MNAQVAEFEAKNWPRLRAIQARLDKIGVEIDAVTVEAGGATSPGAARRLILRRGPRLAKLFAEAKLLDAEVLRMRARHERIEQSG